MTFSVVFLLALGVSVGGAGAENSPDPVGDLHLRASRAALLGSYEEARKYYLQELDLLIADGKQVEAAGIYLELGELTQIHGAFPAAESDYKTGLDLLKRYAQPNDFRLAGAMDDLGWLYITWGRFLEGSRLMDLARTKAQEAQQNNPDLIRHLDMQGAYQLVAGRYSEAKKDWNRALDIGKMTYGPDSPEYAAVFVHLGQANALYGDYDAASQMFRRFFEIEDPVSTLPSTSWAMAAGELAHAYVQLRKFSEARPWFDQALSIFKGDQDRAPLVHSILLSYLGDYYMAQDSWRNAESEYRQALDLRRKVLGDNNAVAATMISLSKALQKLHLKEEAKELLARAKAMLANQKSPPMDQTVDVMALRRP
jgi:tetratricopeptide (TPR) repeat protein